MICKHFLFVTIEYLNLLLKKKYSPLKYNNTKNNHINCFKIHMYLYTEFKWGSTVCWKVGSEWILFNSSNLIFDSCLTAFVLRIEINLSWYGFLQWTLHYTSCSADIWYFDLFTVKFISQRRYWLGKCVVHAGVENYIK